MIDQSRTRWNVAIDMPIASGVTKLNEGAALVQVLENGEAKVKLSAGAANEIFAGVSYSQLMTPDSAVDVRTYTVPATPFKITLPNKILDIAQVQIKKADGTVFTVDAGAPTGTTDVQGATGSDVLTFHSADEGASVTVTYRYALTVFQARALAGDGIPGIGNPVQASGSVGVIQDGTVYTDQFNPANDWTAANVADIKTGANGYFVRGGSGAAVKGFVVGTPTTDRPYLGIRFQTP